MRVDLGEDVTLTIHRPDAHCQIAFWSGVLRVRKQFMRSITYEEVEKEATSAFLLKFPE